MAFHGAANADLVPANASSSALRLQTASRASTKNENKPFKFLDLPSELRNRIYKIHLEEEGSLTITRGNVSLTIPTFGVNLLRCCKQIYKEAALYVKPRYGCLVMALRIPINDWHSWRDSMFDERVHFRDLSSSMLANVVKLRLDIPVCSSDTDHLPRPTSLRLPIMKHLRCIDAYFHLQGCSKQPYRRWVLKEWLLGTARTHCSQMAVIQRIHVCHKHDVACMPVSCVLAVSEDGM